MVPKKPPRILLNFNDASSPEARLRNAIFNKNTETTTACAVVRGMGGLGKTCALFAIGNHKEVIERFPDGVIYMSLGSEATKTDLIHGLAKFFKRSGGEKEGIEIESEKVLNDAIVIAAKWFQGPNFLFLIDDIWHEKDIPRGVIDILNTIVSHKDARMAFTTRYHANECDICAPFEKREVSDPEKNLLHAADLRSQESCIE